MTTEPTPLPPSPPAPTLPPAPLRQTSALAVTALVGGILGWTLMPFLGSLLAVITGHMARAEIRRSGDQLEGDGMAVAGLVLGWVSIGLGVLCAIGVVLIIVFFGSLAAFLAATQS
jgi:hypothetical protein